MGAGEGNGPRGPAGTASISWDWGNTGTDGCLSGGPGAGAMVAYVLDEAGNYAILVVSGTSTPIPAHNFDNIVSGVGPNGNDVTLVSPVILPTMFNVVIVDDFFIQVDIGPANGAGLIDDFFKGLGGTNIYFDAGGPYPGVVDVSDLELTIGGIPHPCDPQTGCGNVLVERDPTIDPFGATVDVCWVGTAHALAEPLQLGTCQPTLATCSSDADCGIAGFDGVCLLAPGFSCTIGNPADCFGGGAGPCVADVCVAPPPVPFGPPIPGGCTPFFLPPDGIPDGDGDGFDDGIDCDDGDATTFPGAPQVCDGRNNDCNHSSWPGTFGTNEFDDDFDGLSECAGDCDDANLNCTTDCTDADGDGFCVTTDCNDGSDAAFPGNLEVCDGIDNNCDGETDEGCTITPMPFAEECFIPPSLPAQRTEVLADALRRPGIWLRDDGTFGDPCILFEE